MNFLAHAYLSGNNENLLIGNFIADSVKGKQYQKFNREIQKGIDLHRKIDAFTDTHQVVSRSKIRLKDKYGKYASVLIDIFYDHYLAANWQDYSSISLNEYSQSVYKLLMDNNNILPERVQTILPYMISQNWLLNYSNFKGINQTLQGMSRRSSFESGMEHALKDLEEHYDIFEKDFKEFFPLLILYVNDAIKLVE